MRWHARELLPELYNATNSPDGKKKDCRGKNAKFKKYVEQLKYIPDDIDALQRIIKQ